MANGFQTGNRRFDGENRESYTCPMQELLTYAQQHPLTVLLVAVIAVVAAVIVYKIVKKILKVALILAIATAILIALWKFGFFSFLG